MVRIVYPQPAVSRWPALSRCLFLTFLSAAQVSTVYDSNWPPVCQAGHGDPDIGGGIWKGCIDSSGCYELRDGQTYWYYGVGARTNMRASLGKNPNDYQLADRNWPAVRNESFGKPWAPYCFNTNFVGGPPGHT